MHLVVVEQYTYDANGNRLTQYSALLGISNQAYSYSAEDHVLTVGPDEYVFDVDGYLQSRTTVDGTTNYYYSSRGELLRLEKPDGTVLTYVHDPFGRGIAKQVNGVTVEKYLWADQTTLLAVYDGNDNLLQRYSYADGRTPVSMTTDGATYYLAYDQVGSLRGVTDSSGNLVKRVDYDSFGNVIFDSNPSFTVPFGFAGGLYDTDTKLVRFGFRDYDYGYVLSNPISWVDPLGLWTVNIGISGSINIPLIGLVGIGGAGFGGIVYDGTNWAWYGGGGGGVGAGEGGSFGIQIGGSNAKSVCDLRGPFGFVSASGGAGLIVGGEGYTGSGSHGQSVTGGNFFVGGGGGTSGTAGVTYTWVKPW